MSSFIVKGELDEYSVFQEIEVMPCRETCKLPDVLSYMVYRMFQKDLTNYNLEVVSKHHTAGTNTTYPAKAAVLSLVTGWCCILELNRRATPQEKVQRCFWYSATKCAIIIQKRY
jgi:hypothetical protein